MLRDGYAAPSPRAVCIRLRADNRMKTYAAPVLPPGAGKRARIVKDGGPRHKLNSPRTVARCVGMAWMARVLSFAGTLLTVFLASGFPVPARAALTPAQVLDYTR